MAYRTYLYSAPEADLAAFRRNNASGLLQPTKVTFCSHLLVYPMPAKSQEPLHSLSRALREAIDGGEALAPALWHPLRPPRVHAATRVQECHQRLQKAYASAVAAQTPDDWSATQIGAVITIFAWASEHGEAVISSLEPPHDKERASRVLFPRIERRPA